MISKLKLIVASAALIGLSTTALAKSDHSMKPRKAALREQRIEKRFAKLDANKDGVITLAEMKAAKLDGKRKGKARHRMNK